MSDTPDATPAYLFEVTQEPWINRRLAALRMELMAEVERTAPKATARHAPLFIVEF